MEEVRPTHTIMGRVLFLDEDLMGNRRGAHRDGAQLCSQFVLTLPKNENDLSGLHCSTCGRRDAEHVLISQPCDPVSGASLVPASPAPAPQLAQREPSSAGTTAARRSQQQLDESTDPLARVGAAATAAARPPAVVGGAPPLAFSEEAERVAGPVAGPVAGRLQSADEFKAEVERLVRLEAATAGREEETAASGVRLSSVDDFKAEVNPIPNPNPTVNPNPIPTLTRARAVAGGAVRARGGRARAATAAVAVAAVAVEHAGVRLG